MISEAPAPPADKLAILVWAADPGRPELCATPFYFAAAAAAMDVEVEMYFTARSVELLRQGVAEALQAAAGSAKSVADFRRWLAREYGSVPAGTVVTTGTWCGCMPLQAGDRFEMEFDGLGALGWQF